MIKQEGLIIKQGNLGKYFKDSDSASQDSILGLLKNNRYTLDSLLAEANGVQMCALVPIFRGTGYWRNFLIALLSLSPEIWDAHNIFPEYVQKQFTGEEKEKILAMHLQMIADGRQSPLLSFLKSEKKR
jgi:hypothetical protein